MSNRFTTALLLVCATSIAGCGDNLREAEVEVDGKYYLRSTFQLPHGLPELESPELAAFTALAKDPNRVEAWLLDRLGHKLDEPYRAAFRQLLVEYDVEEEMEKYLSLAAPTYKTALVELSMEVTKITQTLHLHSELELVSSDEDGDRGWATHRFTGMWFEIDSSEVRVDFGDLGVREMPSDVTDFRVQREEEEEALLVLGNQDAIMPYGRMLNYAIDEVLVDGRDPFADSLADLVSATVPCSDIGKLLEILIDKGNDEIYAVACAAAFTELSAAVLPDELAPIEINLSIEGDALITDDDDADRRADRLELGEWDGNLAYPSTGYILRRPSHVFTGERDPSPRNNLDIAL